MILHKYPLLLGVIKILFYKLIMRNCLELNGIPSFNVKASLRFRKNSKIKLNNKSYFAEGTLLRVTENATFSLGENSGFNSYCVITCRDNIQIGNNVMFGPFCTLHDHDHIFRNTDNMKTSGYITKPIIIEDNVWIGGNVVILKGVTIGEGSVIAAGSVITKDVPPHTVVYAKQNIVTKEIETKETN